jgi:hypothetical protein
MSKPLAHIGCQYCGYRGGFRGENLEGQAVICIHCRPDALAALRAHDRDLDTKLLYEPRPDGPLIRQPAWFRQEVQRAKDAAAARRTNPPGQLILETTE